MKREKRSSKRQSRHAITPTVSHVETQDEGDCLLTWVRAAKALARPYLEAEQHLLGYRVTLSVPQRNEFNAHACLAQGDCYRIEINTGLIQFLTTRLTSAFRQPQCLSDHGRVISTSPKLAMSMERGSAFALAVSSALDYCIGHEMSHIRCGHLQWSKLRRLSENGSRPGIEPLSSQALEIDADLGALAHVIRNVDSPRDAEVIGFAIGSCHHALAQTSKTIEQHELETHPHPFVRMMLALQAVNLAHEEGLVNGSIVKGIHRGLVEASGWNYFLGSSKETSQGIFSPNTEDISLEVSSPRDPRFVELCRVAAVDKDRILTRLEFIKSELKSHKSETK